MRHLVLLSFLCAHLVSYAQVTYNLSGHAYLEGEEDHSSLVFSVINPLSQDTLAATSPDSSGFYSIDVSPGFYLLNWSHVGHIPQELGDFAFSTDTVLADVTLLSGFVQDACGEVSGVWPSGSVYDVLCDIEVPEGDTLTIEPGAIVRFMSGTNLVCNGVLQVLGDPSDRVVFTSREPSPLPGDWGHVSLYAQGNTISYLDYEFASDGFIGDGASYTTIDNVVMVGNLSVSANGIYLSNSSDLTISNNTISVTGDFGIYSPGSSNSTIEGNDISVGGSYGIYSPHSPYSVVGNNDISGEDRGINIEHSSNVTIQFNNIEARRCILSSHSDSAAIMSNTLFFDGSEASYSNPIIGIANHSSPNSSVGFNNVYIHNNHGDGGARGVESHDSEIFGNIIDFLGGEDNHYFALSANNSEITGNTINATMRIECGSYAIHSHGSESHPSLISDNTIAIHECSEGMQVSHAHVVNNTLSFNSRGISAGTGCLIDNNAIASNNTAIQASGAASVVISNNTIACGSTAIHLSSSGASISRNLIESQGRGVEMSNHSGGEIVNNTIISPNSGDYGVHMSDLTMPVVQNNIVEGFANGIYAENALQNQFIRNNNLWNISGDLFSGTAMPPLVGEMIDLNLNGDECDIYSNLNLDPLFVNSDSADYTLQLASPCINAGSEGSEPDPDGTIADIGAFYYPNPPIDTTTVVNPVTYNLSGHAYLEGEEDHSSLVFSVINPLSQDTLAATSPDSSGFYSIDVSPGFYLLNWSHVGHIPQELGDFAFSTDTVLADVTLLSGFVQDACGEVSGVWPSGSVYDVLCDIEVPEGDTLTIEPGAIVRFMSGTNLVCNGVLQVLGDPSDRVVFTSREPSPLPGDWGHVSLYAQGNTISYLDYEFASDGFIGDGASYTTIDNVVMVGNLSVSANGIYLSNSSDLTISNNTISVTGDFGIYSPGSSNSTIEGNDISVGGSYGIYSPHSPYSVVGNNDISGEDRGINIEHSSNVTIQFNNIEARRCILSSHSDSAAIMSNTLFFDGSEASYSNPIIGIANHSSPNSSVGFNNVYIHNNHGDGGARGVESHDSEIFGNIIDFLGGEDNHYFALSANNSEITGNTINATMRIECGSYAIHSHGSESHPSLISDNTIAIHECSEGMQVSHAHVVNNTLSFNSRGISAGTGCLIDNNAIASNNTAIQASGAASVVISNNTIACGSTAIHLSSSGASISRNLIESQGRGVEMSNHSGGEIVNNTIISPNSGDYGVHMSDLTMPVVQNNIVEGFANGIYAENALQNQFIRNNNLWNISGDLFSGTAMPPLVGEMIDLNLNGDECDIYSNLNLDPLFVNSDSADYTLQLASPCINAGSEGSEPDPDGTIADIGAFYYPNPPIDTTTVVNPVTYNLSGHAYLEGEEDHSSLVFSVINPLSQDTLAATSPDSSGFYSIDVSPGFYLLNWSHVGHIPQELGDFAFSTDTVLADVTLLSGFVQDACGEVSGVWPSGSVYDVLCDIEVPEGDTLTIEPGAIVRFMSGTNLVCNGVLQVLGDPSDRVVFTSREPSPLPGDWGHVSLYAQGNTISYLDYEFASDGFIGDGASYTTIDNVVMVGNLSVSANGIYLSNSSDLTISNNTISVTGDFGIYSPGSSNSTIEGNDISVGGSYGIYSPHSPYSVVGNNDISGEDRGINIEHSSNVTIQFNNIEARRCILSSHSDSAAIMSNTLFFDGSEASYSNPIIGIANHSSPNSSVGFNNVYIHNNHGDGGARGVESHDSEIFGNIIDFLGGEDNHYFALSANNSEITGNTINATMRIECGSYAIHSHGSESHPSLISDNTIAIHECSEGMQVSHAHVVNNTLSFNSRGISAGTGCLIDNNAIASNNTAIQASGAASVVISNNTIACGSTAIHLSSSGASISRNLIESQGRGVEMSNHSGGEIVNNTIISPNSGDYGVHMSDLTMPVVQNNIVEGFANGIYAENALQNQFIRNNNLWNISGDLFSGTAMPPLVGEMIDLNLNGDECDIYSNLNLDPLFVNSDSADYTLQLASPCINAGSEGSEPDPDGTIADIGAFYNPIPYGCTDPAAANYDEDAYLDNGTCLYGGCMYADACNFDPEATIDDESCDFNCLTTGCSDEAAINYDVFADGSDDGGCLFIGCQDETALNYDISANYPGLCEYLELCPGDFSGDGLVDIVDLLDLFTMWDNVCPWIVD